MQTNVAAADATAAQVATEASAALAQKVHERCVELVNDVK